MSGQWATMSTVENPRLRQAGESASPMTSASGRAPRGGRAPEAGLSDRVIARAFP